MFSETVSAPASVDTILAPLAAVLSTGELLAIRALVVQFGRLPDELVRHDDVLHIRYMIMFWRVVGEQPEVFSGMFPNEALHRGVVRIA
jgi:hypothetical protein